MLQAKYSSSYRKKGTGTLMFVYIVTGQAKELQAYIEAMVKRTGKPEAELKDENGNPLHWVNPEQRLANGQTTGKTINLSISRNGAVVEDTTDSVIARGNRIVEKMEDKEADYLVQRKFGLIQFGTAVRSAQRQQTAASTETGDNGGVKDELDTAVQQMQEEKIVKVTALAGAGAEEGTEGLGE